MRAFSVVVGLVLLFGARVAQAQTTTPTPNASVTTANPPPQLSAPAPNPLLAASPPKRAPAQALPEPHVTPRWVKPVGWVLIGGAIAFAAASIAVVSSGPTSDEQRVDIGAGLGAGFIACALGGVIVQFAVH